MRRSIRFSILAAAFALTRSVGAQPIAEFALPRPNSQPGAIVAGPDGALWFGEAGFVGRITTAGAVTEFPVEAYVGGITVGPDGALWFTQGDSLGRMTTSGQYTRFALPASDGFASTIVSGPDGALWYVRRNTNRIGRMATSGQAAEYDAIPESPGASVFGLASGPDGALWFTSSAGIGRLTTAGSATLLSNPFRIAVFSITAGPDALYFPDCHLFPTLSCDVGRLATDDTFTTIPLAARGRADTVIVVAPDGALWFNEFDRIGVVRPDGTFTELPVETPNADVGGIAAGPDGAMWFTERQGNKVGRVGTAAHCGDPELLCFDQAAYQVAASWTNPDGSAGVGHPVPMSDESGYFWFFEPGNVEVVVKLLNGCPVNGRTWFFAAGMTNLAVTLTVRSVASGETKTYSSPAGAAFTPIVDTAAFADCGGSAAP